MDVNRYYENYSGDKSKLLYLFDRVKLSKKNYKTVFTDFLTPEEAMLLKRICHDEYIKASFFGENDFLDRTMGAIFQNELIEEFPISVLKITGNFKFEKLNHRDYLGTLLSLGIKREKIGDINVFDDGAEVFIHNDICSYVALNLTKIKHTGVKTLLIDVSAVREKIQEFKEYKVSVSSLRLDCVVASIINLSRSIASSLIKSGDVKLNHSINFEINSKVKAQDLISIKGYGRFIIDDMLGLTKSERLTLLIKKYL